ncbi:YqeB family protein [Streptomyces sp. YGL11-2]|uniref:YqeB family protein n=1 Tax=Streptomyces sp. YGL11-2 TaxID=3414028 RepID=UPI003CE9B957
MGKRDQRDPAADGPTVLGRATWSTVCIYLVFAVVGAGAGWLVGVLAGWLVTLPWAPMQGPARLLTSIPEPWLPVVGTVAGLVLGRVAQYEELVIRLTADRVTLTRKGRERKFSRDAVATSFRDGGELVLLGHDGGELARQECDMDIRRLADAFTEYGYVWVDADPHRDDFRRWVPATPGLPEGANALLTARQEVLKKKGPSDDDVRELRDELARLGVVVKDVKRRQYWRTIRGTGPAAD